MTIELANRLIEFRKKAGYSQEELADKLGVSRQAISKWERAEASPDTDNLIALAKLYNISLDELVGNNINKEETDFSTNNKENKARVDIGPGHVDVEDEDGSKVHIAFDGIQIQDNEHNVHINRVRPLLSKAAIFWLAFESSFLLIVTLTYIFTGLFYKGTMGTTNVNAWAGLWPLFILTPIPNSLREAITKKRFCMFAFPCLIIAIYCFLGMLLNMWHPMWVLFLLIPVYYCFFGIIDSKCRRNRITVIDNK